MRKDQKQKYRNFGIFLAASGLVIGGTVLAETYTGSQDTASSSIVKKETESKNKIVSADEKVEKTSSKQEKKGNESSQDTEASNNVSETVLAAPSQEAVVASVSNMETSYTYDAPVTLSSAQSGGMIVLANGNTAGEHGAYAAARMAELTGVSASTWESIIARESNGDIYAANASGASGLFQTMPGWGSTASVDDQIQAAYNAYSNQGMAAWGY